MLTRVICFFLSIFGIVSPVTYATEANDISAWSSFGKNDSVYARVNTEEKVIALTFDDGPHPYLTPKILDMLKEYEVKATFFVIGKNAELYPKVLKRISDEGHEIGNHTYSHLAESTGNNDKLKSEIEKTEEIIYKITGQNNFLFRPPTGYCSKSAVNMVKDMNYKTIVWDIDTRDWAHTKKEDMLANVKKFAACGSIILMHDFIGYNSPTPEALKIILPWLKANGYRFVTISEMISLDD